MQVPFFLSFFQTNTYYLDHIFFLLSLSLIPWTWSLITLLWLKREAWVVVVVVVALVVVVVIGFVVLMILVILGGSDFLILLPFKPLDTTIMFSVSPLLNSRFLLVPWVESFPPLIDPWLIGRFTEFELLKM